LASSVDGPTSVRRKRRHRVILALVAGGKDHIFLSAGLTRCLQNMRQHFFAMKFFQNFPGESSRPKTSLNDRLEFW
jgi:hypothetical protein